MKPVVFRRDTPGYGVSLELDAAVLSGELLTELAASARRNSRVGLVCIKNAGAVPAEVMKAISESMGERVLFCF